MRTESSNLEQIIENMSNGQQSENRIFLGHGSQGLQTESDGPIEITPEDLIYGGV